MTHFGRVLPLLLTLQLLSVQVQASPFQSDPLARFGSLRSSLELRRQRGAWSLEYCPDNTCEVFSCRARKCHPALLDFGFMYLSHVSGYFYLSEFRRKDVPAVTPILLKQYKTTCPQPVERDAIFCILRTLHKNANITVSYVRYDEGERNEQAVNLEEELRRASQP
jgi:hypothetical protein